MKFVTTHFQIITNDSDGLPLWAKILIPLAAALIICISSGSGIYCCCCKKAPKSASSTTIPATTHAPSNSTPNAPPTATHAPTNNCNKGQIFSPVSYGKTNVYKDINMINGSVNNDSTESSRETAGLDMSARNYLLGKNDELKTCDFGLSIADRSMIELENLLPQTLPKEEFSKKSDVWSFGVLMWEIITRCKSVPYPGDTNQEAKKKILSGNHPLKAPEGSPAIGDTILEMGLIQETKDRPEFEGTFKLLSPNEKPPVNTDNMFETYAP